MKQETPNTIFDWYTNQLNMEGRADFVTRIGPHLASLVKPGDHVLDLGCGAGPVAFFLEEQGAQVTGIDLTPALIALARQEANKRGSNVRFIQDNVRNAHLRKEAYDLAVCLGNVILDFPHQDFARFRDNVHQALKIAGQFALNYSDGVLRLATMSDPKEVVEQGTDGQIIRRFKEYDPEIGAYVAEYRHLESGQTYEYTGYIYTGPMIRMVLEPEFKLLHSMRLPDGDFLDIYSN